MEENSNETQEELSTPATTLRVGDVGLFTPESGDAVRAKVVNVREDGAIDLRAISDEGEDLPTHLGGINPAHFVAEAE